MTQMLQRHACLALKVAQLVRWVQPCAQSASQDSQTWMARRHPPARLVMRAHSAGSRPCHVTSVLQARSMTMVALQLRAQRAHQVGEALQVRGSAFCVLLDRLTRTTIPPQLVHNAILASTPRQEPWHVRNARLVRLTRTATPRLHAKVVTRVSTQLQALRTVYNAPKT